MRTDIKIISLVITIVLALIINWILVAVDREIGEISGASIVLLFLIIISVIVLLVFISSQEIKKKRTSLLK